MKTVNLTNKECEALTIMLNVELRNLELNLNYAEVLNSAFRKIVGTDHSDWKLHQQNKRWEGWEDPESEDGMTQDGWDVFPELTVSQNEEIKAARDAGYMQIFPKALFSDDPALKTLVGARAFMKAKERAE